MKLKAGGRETSRPLALLLTLSATGRATKFSHTAANTAHSGANNATFLVSRPPMR